MSLDTWVSTGVLLGTLLTLFAYLSSAIRGLRAEMSDLRGEIKVDINRLDARISDLRTEFKAEIGDLRVVVQRLDQRIYDLATGATPRPLIVPPSH